VSLWSRVSKLKPLTDAFVTELPTYNLTFQRFLLGYLL
jgi:hypothetical protein